MDISKFSITELESLAYRLLVQHKEITENMKIVEQQIRIRRAEDKKEQEKTEEPTVEPTKKPKK